MRIAIDMQGAQTASRLRGIGRYTLSLVHAILRNKGDHEVFLLLSGLFPDGIKDLQEEYEGLLPPENIKIWSGFGKREEFNARPELLSINEKMREAFLADLRPDVVLITSLFDHEAVSSIGLLKETFPTAVIFYDLYPLIKPDPFQLRKPVRERYSRRLGFLKKSKLLLAISESSRQEALSYFDFEPEAVVNIFGGACSKIFHLSDEAKSNKEDVWEKFEISKPFVMYAGTDEERKNLERLIKAYAQLDGKIREKHQLVFVGPISTNTVRDIAGKAGLARKEFLLLGHVSNSEMLTLYNTCALSVCPSLYEGLGLPAMEAMLCGAPVIGSNATSLPEVIGLDEALFDPYSVEEISSKMSRALTDKQFRTLLLEHGKNQSAKFSWDESAKRALQAMEQLVPQRMKKLSPQLTVERKGLFGARKLRILAIKLDHLGDFLLTIPALTKLKARYPHAVFDLVVGSWNVPVAKSLGFFDKIFTYDFLRPKQNLTQNDSQNELDELLDALGHYDIAIDFRRHLDGRFLLTQTKSLLKVGYQTHQEEIDQLLNIALPTNLDRNFEKTATNNIPMAKQLLALVDALPKDDNDFVLLPEIVKGVQRKPGSIAIFPKAGGEVKEWAASNFSDLIEQLLASPQVHSIELYFANQAEAADFSNLSHQKIAKHIGLPFEKLVESLASNEICIANDSGGGHLAAYLGVTPLVIFSGRDSADEWGPQFNESYIVSHKTICAPCHLGKKSDCFNSLACLNGISVDDIYSLVLEILEANSHSKGARRGSEKGISLQKGTDAVVAELIEALAEDAQKLNEAELAALATSVSDNHPPSTCNVGVPHLTIGTRYDHRSHLIGWIGFSGIEPEFRWTDGHHSEIHFYYPPNQPASGILSLQFDTFGSQRIMASLNEKRVYEREIEEVNKELKIPVTNLKTGFNALTLKLPDAMSPGGCDTRKVALAVRMFKVDPKTSGASQGKAGSKQEILSVPTTTLVQLRKDLGKKKYSQTQGRKKSSLTHSSRVE